MEWLHPYQLVLFDFDGLLVNTEHLHQLAYERLGEELGCFPQWDFRSYCSVAHRGAHDLRDYFYSTFPALKQAYPDWNVLYERKQALYEQILREGRCELMPGAPELLDWFARRRIPQVVVTNSRTRHVSIIRSQLPALDLVSHWIMREDYSKPKPDPEGYLVALERFGSGAERVVGFEDTPRGLQALQQTRAQSVLVCIPDHPLLETTPLQETIHLPSLRMVLQS